MKLLVFASVPPPHHGQNYMVRLMLDGFGGDQSEGRGARQNPFGIECYHVDARFSGGVEDIGKFQPGKLARLFLYCVKAIWCRLRYGVNNFYYVPAPGKKVALYRDWLVLLICRPFFQRVIFHWHAAGLGEWLETSAPRRAGAISRKLFKGAALSVVLAKYNAADAEKLLPQRVCVVSNGIPDPCPDFDQTILRRRLAGLEARQRLTPGEGRAITVLFLAHCTREKGLFDTLEGVAQANSKLKKTNSSFRLRLKVAGEFFNPQEEAEFKQRVSQLQREFGTEVEYVGFLSGEAKHEAFASSDCFCFPTYYGAESFGLVIVEAMAYGLPVVTTRWRSIPELFPPDYPGLVDPKSPEQIADALIRLVPMDLAKSQRNQFLQHFTLQRHLANLADAIHRVEK
jgi:glycosyltransferase involved in cell wall biosynthesis